MPPKPRRPVPRTSRAGAGAGPALERAKSSPEGGGANAPPRPLEAELHPRAEGLGAVERQRLCHALGIEGADPHALSERIALLESTPYKELRETALRLGAEAAELDRAIAQAEDRKSAALDLALAAGQRVRPPARPPPKLPDRPQGPPPAGASASASDDREHEAALMAWYRAYDPQMADAQHVTRVVRMYKKRARRRAAVGEAPVDWWLLMYAKFEEHNQVDPRDLLNRPVEPQPHMVLPPRPDLRTDTREHEGAGSIGPALQPVDGTAPTEPEPQPVDGTAPTEPEPQPVDGTAPTEAEAEAEAEPHLDPENPAEAVLSSESHEPASELADGARTVQDAQERSATGTYVSEQLPEGVPPSQSGVESAPIARVNSPESASLTRAGSPESADGAMAAGPDAQEGENATEHQGVPPLSIEERRSLSGKWFAQGQDEVGPIDDEVVLSVSAGGTVVCTVDGAKEDNFTIDNCQIDPTGVCELEQVYEDGATTHWRCRYDPSTRTFVDGEWRAGGKIIGRFTATRQPPAAVSTEPEPEPEPPATDPDPDPPRKPGDPPRFVTQRKQMADGSELLIEWEVGRELGKGHFATAYEISKLEDGSIWAAKVVSKKSLRDFPGRPERFQEELDIHASLVADGVRHPNVLFMESFFEDDEFFYIVLEICPHESLLELLAARKTLTEYEVRYIMKQLVAGMIYCHSCDVLHRDLKPANVLLGKDMTVKVADFGYAKQLVGRERRWSVCGTPNYMPPEVVCVAQARVPPGTQIGPGHGVEADVWCMGIMMYVFLCGIPPFQAVEMTIPATYFNIANNHWSFARPDAPGPAPSAAAQDLITKMLAPEPTDRIELPEVLMHPWFSDQEGRTPVPRSLPVTVLKEAPEEALAFIPPEMPTPEIPTVVPIPEAVPPRTNNVMMGPGSTGWVRDGSVTECSCGNVFGSGLTTWRRHHCRACGRIFCDKCSKKSFPLQLQPGGLDTKMERVCDTCYTKLMAQSLSPKQPETRSV